MQMLENIAFKLCVPFTDSKMTKIAETENAQKFNALNFNLAMQPGNS